jgi:hypothetical protein
MMKLEHMNGKKGTHQLFLWDFRKSRIFVILYFLAFHYGGTLPLVVGFNNPKYTKHVSTYHKWLMVNKFRTRQTHEGHQRTNQFNKQLE